MPSSIFHPKTVAGIIISKRKPEGGIDTEDGDSEQDLNPSAPPGEDDAAMQSAAEDLMNAIHMKDANGVSMALKSAFQILDSMPHEEGEHMETPNMSNEEQQ